MYIKTKRSIQSRPLVIVPDIDSIDFAFRKFEQLSDDIFRVISKTIVIELIGDILFDVSNLGGGILCQIEVNEPVITCWLVKRHSDMKRDADMSSKYLAKRKSVAEKLLDLIGRSDLRYSIHFHLVLRQPIQVVQGWPILFFRKYLSRALPWP